MTDNKRKTDKEFTQKPLWQNFITLGGVFIAAVGFVLLFMFGLFSMVTPTSNPYVDIVGYLVVPMILAIGVVFIPIGIFIKSWRIHRRNPEERLVFRFPRFNLHDPQQLRIAKILVVLMCILLPVVAISSYHGYHYSDSSTFCTQACHLVMEPQSTAYLNSSHARVSCAECHIGSGASWFVKSKLSGTRQIFATLGDTFPRPIPSAITELRPARETCERCHWPKKFFGAQLREINHFASDEKNSHREIDMLLKTGGGDETTGRAEGIHMHMVIANNIEYVATDDQLQVIPWVKMTDSAGNELIYRSDGRPSSDPPPEGIVRNFDCMDCHNRPAHKFRTPHESVNTYLEIGKIDPRLPYIKREAIRVLTGQYPDGEVAEAQIGISMAEFYQKNYANDWDALKSSVYQAIDSIREIYRQNFFPEMKVNWATYPDNIGHFNSPGCFRCHEGNHLNQNGEVLSHDCKTCHDFLNPTKINGKRMTIERGEFIHPMKFPPQHENVSCHKCHNGGNTPSSSCTGCHLDQNKFIQGTLGDFQLFEIKADEMADMSCQDCHNLSKPHTWENIQGSCLDCHEGEEVKDWRQEAHSLMENAYKQVLDPEKRHLLDRLQKAIPMHNLGATRKIINKLTQTHPEEFKEEHEDVDKDD